MTRALIALIAVLPLAAAADGPTLTLDEAIRIAHARSPLIRAAKHGVLAIEEGEREVWYSRWLPTLKLRTLITAIPPQGDGTAEDSVLDVLDDDGTNIGSVTIPGEPGPDLSNWNIWSKTDIELGYPLYTFGKLSAATDMAAHGVDAANALLAEAKAELTFETRRAWYTVQLAEGLQDVIDDGESQLRKATEKLEELEEEDSPDYDQNDSFRMRIHEAKVRKLVLGNRKLKRLGKSGLRAALNLQDGVPLNLPAKNELVAVQESICALETLVEVAARERPEIVAQRHRVEVARAQADLRWAEYFPDFFLAANLTIAVSSVPNEAEQNVFEGGQFDTIGGGAAVGLRVTLDYPQKVARYRRAQAELAMAKAEVEARLLLLKLKLEEAWIDAKDNEEMLRVRKRAMRASKSLLTAMVLEYEDGIDESVTFDDVLRAHVEYLSQKSEWLQAIYAFNLSVARLSRVVGIDLSGENGACK